MHSSAPFLSFSARQLWEMGTMKTTGWLVIAATTGALMLQGCAATGDTRASTAQAAPAPLVPAAAPASAAPAAAVPEEHGKPVVKADTADNFAAIVAAIHQQMEPGGRWQFIDKGERATIDGSFADMGKLYDQFGSVDKMDQNAKVRLLADQSTVNAILTKKDGDRLICETVMPVGSHLPVKTCKTYAQIQAEQRGAQELLRQMGPQPQEKGSH
jgi:hypothetical protein